LPQNLYRKYTIKQFILSNIYENFFISRRESQFHAKTQRSKELRALVAMAMLYFLFFVTSLGKIFAAYSRKDAEIARPLFQKQGCCLFFCFLFIFASLRKILCLTLHVKMQRSKDCQAPASKTRLHVVFILDLHVRVILPSGPYLLSFGTFFYIIYLYCCPKK